MITVLAALALPGTTASGAGTPTVFYKLSVKGTQTHTATSTDSGADECPSQSTSSETVAFSSVRPTRVRMFRAAGEVSTSYFNRGDYGSPPGNPLKGKVTRTNGGRIPCMRGPSAPPQDCGERTFSALRADVNNLASRGRYAQWNLADIDFAEPGYEDCETLAPKAYPQLFDRRVQEDQFGRPFVTKVPFAKLFNRRTRSFSVKGGGTQRIRQTTGRETLDVTVTIRYTLTFVRVKR